VKFSTDIAAPVYGTSAWTCSRLSASKGRGHTKHRAAVRLRYLKESEHRSLDAVKHGPFPVDSSSNWRLILADGRILLQLFKHGIHQVHLPGNNTHSGVIS